MLFDGSARFASVCLCGPRSAPHRQSKKQEIDTCCRRVFSALQAVYRLAAAIRGWCQWQERPAGEATPWEQWLETDVPTGWLLLATILCSLAQATVHELTRGGWPVVQADTGLLGWPSTAAHTLWSAAAAAAQLMVQQATASASDAWLMLLAFTIKYTALALTYDWVCRTTLASCRVSGEGRGPQRLANGSTCVYAS